MKNKIAKLYAAYRSGCLGDNIFYAYFPFLATIILEENWDILDEKEVANKFESKYDITLPLSFIRQILGIGVERSVIVVDHGQYVVQKGNLTDYAINDNSFNSCWSNMLDCFGKFCVENGFDLSEYDVESCVLKFFDVYDEDILLSDDLYISEESDFFDYVWHSYLKNLSVTNPELFDFVVSISFSNIMKEAVFYSSDSPDPSNSFMGLNVYLDSPIVFALLGIDSPERIDSCKILVSDMQKAGCIVQVLDNSFDEIKGIMERAAGWAICTDYSIHKANNVAKYFHDILGDAPAIAEFCEAVESNLNKQGVTIRMTNYDVSEHCFQEDEQLLYSMIESRYLEDERVIPEEKKLSIKTDVRSIVMVYRERHGQVSTRIQTSGHLMITLNSSIANISKKYESNKSLNSGHIPACISADLFGSILWLFSPAKKMEYQRKQLLADCYVALRPSKEMLTKYIESLERARHAEEIDEKTFLFMRAHVAVNDALMNVIKGDYARFNDQTYREVYDEIVANADKKYLDEVLAHMQTKERLDSAEKTASELIVRVDDLQARLDARDTTDFNNKCKFYGWITTIILFGIPYVGLIVLIEITKNSYSSLSFSSVLHVGLFVIATILAGIGFAVGKSLCFKKVQEYLSTKQDK